MTDHPVDTLKRFAFRDSLAASIGKTEELNKSLTRMAEVHNGLATMAEVHNQLGRAAAMQESIERMAGIQNDMAQVAGLTSARRLSDFHQEMTKLWEERARAAAEAREAQSAAGCVRRLEAQIRLFESQLDAAHDVGIRLVNFGSEITFHVTDIGSVEPDLIVFSGKTQAGAPVRLIQQRSQVDFLLTTLERSDPDQPKRPVGFHHQ